MWTCTYLSLFWSSVWTLNSRSIPILCVQESVLTWTKKNNSLFLFHFLNFFFHIVTNKKRSVKFNFDNFFIVIQELWFFEKLNLFSFWHYLGWYNIHPKKLMIYVKGQSKKVGIKLNIICICILYENLSVLEKLNLFSFWHYLGWNNILDK
jgi:hypothetical protein